MLDFLLLLDQARRVLWNIRDLIDVPDIAGLLDIFVAVDLGLFESPFR